MEQLISQITSEKRLAANRANALKSTGPKSPAGKARSASNSLQHGLYSLSQFELYLEDNNFALAVADNLMAEHLPCSPTEHFLVHQLIHDQLRLFQMRELYKKALASGIDSCKHLPLILRELDRLPGRMLRTLKALRQEQKRINEETEIEAVQDLPILPDSECTETNPNPPNTRGRIEGNRIFRLLMERLKVNTAPSGDDTCSETPVLEEFAKPEGSGN